MLIPESTTIHSSQKSWILKYVWTYHIKKELTTVLYLVHMSYAFVLLCTYEVYNHRYSGKVLHASYLFEPTGFHHCVYKVTRSCSYNVRNALYQFFPQAFSTQPQAKKGSEQQMYRIYT